MSDVVDPRSEIGHPLNIGNVYEDSRTGDPIKVIYIDEDVVLMRDTDGNHRVNERRLFERYVGSDRYSLTDEDFGYAGRLDRVLALKQEYGSSNGRKGSHKAEALEEALTILTEDERSFESVDYENIDGVGEKTAKSLRASGYKTVEDVRRASDEELLDCYGVGAGNLENIKDACSS